MRSAEVSRAARVSEQIRTELMDLVLRGEIRDPSAEGVLVSAVRSTDDLQHARVYLRLLNPIATAVEQEAAVAAMTRAGPFLRRELGRRLHLRYIPTLRFYWDEAVDYGRHIETLLSEIREPAGDDVDP